MAMARQTGSLRVRLSADGFWPQAFMWEDMPLRVLAVEGVRTEGRERRYRLATREGSFELALDTQTGRWRVRRAPHWWNRLAARWQRTPRYPVPAWRRRQPALPQPSRQSASPPRVSSGRALRVRQSQA
jgi:hypothetical protein